MNVYEIAILFPLFSLLISYFFKGNLRSFFIILGPAIAILCWGYGLISPEKVSHFELLKLHDQPIEISLFFSKTSSLICMVVNTILFCTLLYSHSLNKRKFALNNMNILLNIFSVLMCIAVVSHDLLSFFICFEAIGYTSYILIEKSDGNTSYASTTSLAFSKFASILLLIAISIIFKINGSLDLTQLGISLKQLNNNDLKYIEISANLMLIACMCKSAIFPFSYWLIKATKANIIVSIMLHSSTIVALGVILICKTFFLFDQFQYLGKLLIIFGIISAILSSISAFTESKIKKILAYSTICYTSLMFVLCGSGAYALSVLFLICHALFKALLFLAFALVIHAMSNEQNLLKMGGIYRSIPRITTLVVLSIASSIGLPYVVSYFSKSESVLYCYAVRNFGTLISFLVANTIITASTLRLGYISIFSESKADDTISARIADGARTNIVSFYILLVFAIILSFVSWVLYRYNYLTLGDFYLVPKTIAGLQAIALEVFSIFGAVFLVYFIRSPIGLRFLKTNFVFKKICHVVSRNLKIICRIEAGIIKKFYEITKKVSNVTTVMFL